MEGNPKMEVARTPTCWHEIFMSMARASAGRSKDPSSQCGAVLVSKSNNVLGTGFNGPPPQIEDLLVPWGERPEKYFWVFHAEENAINFATDSIGRSGIAGSTIYVTTHPCSRCVLRMIRDGVSRVIFDDMSKRPLMVDSSHDVRINRIMQCLKPNVCFEIVPFSSLAMKPQ